MKDDQWTLEEEGEMRYSVWAIWYRLVENSEVKFEAKELEQPSSGLKQYRISLITLSPNFPFSIDTSGFVREIESFFPGCTNSYPPDFGFGLTTNNLSELFQWVDRLKIVLANLYRDYGYEITT